MRFPNIDIFPIDKPCCEPCPPERRIRFAARFGILRFITMEEWGERFVSMFHMLMGSAGDIIDDEQSFGREFRVLLRIPVFFGRGVFSSRFAGSFLRNGLLFSNGLVLHLLRNILFQRTDDRNSFSAAAEQVHRVFN